MSCAPDALPRVHDLILLPPVKLDPACMAEPSWVGPALSHTPWAVVRRASAPSGKLAVGVRGSQREQRWAAFMNLPQGTLVRKPTQLRSSQAQDPRKALPAIQALMFAETILEQACVDWGPIGSVGFELATGAPAATRKSDLDLVLFAQQRISPNAAIRLLRSLAASPVRIDLRVETPVCGFSLEEYAHAASKKILVRLPSGHRLVEDPWALSDERTE